MPRVTTKMLTHDLTRLGRIIGRPVYVPASDVERLALLEASLTPAVVTVRTVGALFLHKPRQGYELRAFSNVAGGESVILHAASAEALQDAIRLAIWSHGGNETAYAEAVPA